jgi:cholesterol oxidase
MAPWPQALTLAELTKYYEKAEFELNVQKHPRFKDLRKIQALERRAIQIGGHAEALNLAVNFEAGKNPQGLFQEKCTDCGDCVTGCNVTAKNTLDKNYLQIAAAGQAEIFTQTKVEWIVKTANGWRVHGRFQKSTHQGDSDPFDIEADNVILSAGAVNSTEILLRSANLHNLSVSPALGTRFGGNGDFFGLSYNGDPATETLGFGTPPQDPPLEHRPGPTIVGLVRHNNGGPLLQRFSIEDLSFPSAFVTAARLLFPAVGDRGEDTDAGDSAAEKARVDKDRLLQDIYNGALNHTMLYLCMGFDDARGTFEFSHPFWEPDGRVRVRWNGAGQQEIFTRINDELRRHAKAQGGTFVANPLWNIPRVNHLITAHPLGGCPMSDDFVTGATDQFGRVYKKDGSVHTGLYVADGSLLPTALAVNPFLTISAVSERIAEKISRVIQGQDTFPAPTPSVGFAGVSAIEIVERPEAELERVFQAAPSLGIETMMNTPGDPVIDPVTKVIRNDNAWKGFFRPATC